MNERRKFDRRKTDQTNSFRKKMGSIYRIGTPPDEAIIKLLKPEGEFVMISILAESLAESVLDKNLGYKVHKNFKPLKSGTQVPPKELPLYLSWPYRTTDYYRALKGEN